MYQRQNLKVWNLEFWALYFFCYLRFGYWNFFAIKNENFKT